jgi:hypothetical protein
VDYKQAGPHGTLQPLRDGRSTVSFSCVVLSVHATSESLTQRRVVCADHVHAHPTDTLTVHADCHVIPKALLPGARVRGPACCPPSIPINQC